MSSKRQRGEGSSSQPSKSYDKKKFTSAAAYDRFIKLTTKTVIPERGLRPDENRDGELAVMIAERDWFTLTEQPDPAVTAVVKEFYANAKEHDHFAVRVRGKTVSFASRAINRYYQLPPPDTDEYAEYVANGPDYDLIVNKLCRPGTQWVIKDKDAMQFRQSALSRYGKAWYSFICAKLMPSTHVSDVTKERAVLLYCLVLGMKINVGRVINRSIIRVLEHGTRGGLPHPSLICALCLQAGVKWEVTEPISNPRPLLDHGLICRYIDWGGAEADPRGLGYMLPPTAADPMQTAPTTPSTSTPVGSSFQELSTQLRRLQNRMDRHEHRLDLEIHRIAKRQGEVHEYHAQCNKTLVELFTTINPNAATIQFPEPPRLSTYPPSDLDDEDEDEDDSGDDDASDADASSDDADHDH